MKITRRESNEDAVEALYAVEDLEPDEISEPSEEFVRFVAESPELGFLNKYTIGRFMKQVRERFTAD